MALPIIEQAKEFFAKLTNTQKISIGVAVTAAITGLILLVAGGNDSQMTVLFSELEQKDAATIVEKLKEQGIPYELSGNGTGIMVPQENVYDLRLKMAKEGLPANSTVGYEIFDKTNLGMSDAVQKLNMKRALEGELQKTISGFEEIQKVRVMIVLPEKMLFEKDQKKPTASVHIRLKSGRSMNKLNVEGIQNLVSSSVEGLSATDVTVVDQRGQILSDKKKDENSLAGLSSTQYEQQQKVDEYLIVKVQSLLDGVLGAGNAVVRVNTDLDFTQLERTKENFDPEGQVIESEEKINEQRKTQDSLDYPAVNNESSSGRTRVNYKNSKTIERMVSAVGVVKRISASVMINGTTKVVEENGEPTIKYTPRSEEEMQKLTQIIRNAIGYDPQRNDQVSVVNLAFDTTAQEEELKNKEWDLPMSPNDIIEKVLLAIAMILAVWMIRKLFASPHVRRKIEEIINPPIPVLPVVDNQHLYSDMVIGPDGQLMPASAVADTSKQLEEGSLSMITREELLERARKRLDQNQTEELSEEQLMIEEMKHRIQTYLLENEEEGKNLLKLLLSKH
jgi:flagellar M-ring protein FliF